MSPDLAPLLASGLLDRDWVGAQLGTVFATDEDAAMRCLDPDTDCSPHPLYEADWSGRPVAEYVVDALARTTVSPHPLVDLTRIVAEHPTAVQHAYGPLAWWITRAREDSPVPVPDGVPEITWGRLRGAALEAAQRRAELDDVRLAQRRTRQRPQAEPDPPSLPAPGTEPLVSVILVVHDDGPRLRAVVDAVQAQTYGGWELVVVDDGSADDTAAVLAGVAAFEPRVVPVAVPRGGPARARNAALGKARGKYVAFVDPGHTWDPEFLRVMLGHLEADGAPMLHAAMRVAGPDGDWFRAVDGGRDHLLAHHHVDLAALVARRDVVEEAGGFDEELGGAESLDLLVKLAEHASLRLVPRVLLDRAGDAPDDDPRWTAAVLERHLVDWTAAQHRPRDVRKVSIVLHTTADLDRTVRWVTRTMSRRREGADLELVVVGARLPRAVELPLAMLLATYPDARLLAPLSRVGPAVCTNVGIAETSGEVVVLARTSANPPRDAFHGLTSALADRDVAIAQPLVVDRPGLVVSAGAVFGPGRTHPEPFLAGYPVADAQSLSSREVPAPLSPVVAVRGSELVRLRGLDVSVGDALPEVELGIRMAAHGGGTTVVVPKSPLVLKAGRLPRLDTAPTASARCRSAGRSRRADPAARAGAGLEVVGRRWEDRAYLRAPTIIRSTSPP